MDLISRQAAIDALRKMQTYKLFSGDDMLLIDQAGAMTELMLLPPAQPEPLQPWEVLAAQSVLSQPEITHEQAVAYLQSTGWLQEHDRQMMLDGVHRLTAQPEPHWIPVEQALPEEPFGCLVTVMDTNPVTMEEFENILPYFVGWDGEQWNDGDGQQCPFEVLAWWELPEPYKEVTE